MRITVKLGGSILEDTSARAGVLDRVRDLRAAEHEVILVHGGGKALSRRLSQLGLASRFVDGLRVTDEETLSVAIMVLAGQVNKTLVAELDRVGTAAVGICGADAGVVRCTPVSGIPGEPEGLGFVGRPVSLDSRFLDLLLGSGMVPVISSIGIGSDSALYNVNADQMAAACAWGGDCSALVYLTDVPGIRDENGDVIARIGARGIEELRKKGILSGGMLPKTNSCLEALQKGVRSVYIVPGSSPHLLTRLVEEGPLQEGTWIDGSN